MKETVLQIGTLSVFCGLALSLTPEGSVKRATALCCSVVLLLCLLTQVRQFDYGTYSLELSRYRELGESLRIEAEDRSQRLNRLVIEQEIEAYIHNQAALLGLEDLNISVGLHWSTEGFWVPDSVTISGTVGAEAKKRLTALISAEIGIEEDHQEWLSDETGKPS